MPRCRRKLPNVTISCPQVELQKDKLWIFRSTIWVALEEKLIPNHGNGWLTGILILGYRNPWWIYLSVKRLYQNNGSPLSDAYHWCHLTDAISMCICRWCLPASHVFAHGTRWATKLGNWGPSFHVFGDSTYISIKFSITQPLVFLNIGWLQWLYCQLVGETLRAFPQL